MTYWLNVGVSGVTIGAVYAIIALGYNVGFMTTHVLSFANAALFMAGGMLFAFLSPRGMGTAWALAAAILVPAAVNVAVERLAVRPFVGSQGHRHGWVVSTLGASTIAVALVALLISHEDLAAPVLFPLTDIGFAGIRLIPANLAVICYAVAAAAILHLLYRKSLLGAAMSSVAQDVEAARLRGIPVGLLAMLSFGLAGAIVGLGGALATLITGASPGVWLLLALKGFMAAAIGGIPQVWGAVIGGIALGLVETFVGALIGPAYRDLVVFIVLVVILVGRPQGLMGSGAKVREV